jgi:hypothetical protein
VGPYLERRVVYEEADSDTVAVGPALRPYLLTSGRVVADNEAGISIETQVVATDSGLARRDRIPFEAGTIVGLCEEPMSVAEIGARLGLHLGVVQILVADLSGQGHLAVYLPNFDAAAHVDTLRRVIHGLLAIS